MIKEKNKSEKYKTLNLIRAFDDGHLDIDGRNNDDIKKEVIRLYDI